MPENAVSVTRPGKWGNPFKVGLWFRRMASDWSVWSYSRDGQPGPFGNESVETLEQSLSLFEEYARGRVWWDKDWLTPLKGKDLACWCKEGATCHADILLRLANEPPARA
jgi:Domain of unknown function (DUF4326)